MKVCTKCTFRFLKIDKEKEKAPKMKKKKKCSVREHPTGRETPRNKTVNKERTHLNKNTYNHGGMCRGAKFKKD